MTRSRSDDIDSRPDNPQQAGPAGDPPQTALGERELVAAHRRGDPDAMGRLLRLYQRRVYGVCYRMLRDRHEARDLTQDALLKVLEGLDSYDGRSKLSTWVVRVTMNCCLSHLRKQRLRRHASLDAPGPDGATVDRGPLGPAAGELSPSRHVERAEMRAILLRALGGLDPDMRAVIVLRDLQDLEYHTIADVLDIPVGTVKSRLFRARAALRAAAEKELAEAPPDPR